MAAGGGAPGDTGGGKRDACGGRDESRSMDEGGASDRGESSPSLIMRIGLIESGARSPGLGGSGLGGRPDAVGGSGLGRGGAPDRGGRTLGSRGFGGGRPRSDALPSSPERASPDAASALDAASAAATDGRRGVGTGSLSLSSLIEWAPPRGTIVTDRTLRGRVDARKRRRARRIGPRSSRDGRRRSRLRDGPRGGARCDRRRGACRSP